MKMNSYKVLMAKNSIASETADHESIKAIEKTA